MILVVSLNPTIQKTLLLDRLVPGEVNRATHSFWNVSGKGVNVARIIGQLGGEAIHLTHAGGRFRDWFLSMAKSDGVSVTAPDSGSEIRLCHTVIDRSCGQVTELVEEGPAVKPEAVPAVQREFERMLGSCDTIVFSGTKSGGYDATVIPGFVAAAKAEGKRVILDIRGPDLAASLPYRPDVIKPNFDEFARTFLPDHPPDAPEAETERAVIDAMRAVAAEYETTPVVTRGAADTLAAIGGCAVRFPVAKVEVANPIGCGDAFAAGLALALSSGESIEVAMRWGHDAAARCARTIRPGSLL
jgi:1-phosphofructokinase family hexose kinase